MAFHFELRISVSDYEMPASMISIPQSAFRNYFFVFSLSFPDNDVPLLLPGLVDLQDLLALILHAFGKHSLRRLCGPE